MYCLKLDGTGAEDNISVIERTKGSISSAEIQIEKLGNSSFEEIGKIIKNADIPVTVSSRADESLGENTKELLLSAAERGAAYIDTDNRDLLSDEEFIMKVRSFGAHMIYSLYYNGVPDNLWEEVDSAYRFASRAVSRCASAFPAASRSVLQPGCVVKAVCLLRGVEDALGLCRTADRLSHIERKLILGEGEYALFSH
ncbi:MAG: hypothetical protein R6V67_01835, partial [Spirochaetia bacterium]